MAKVSFNGQTLNCTTAIKGADYIHLLDADGLMIAAFDGVTNFSSFSISGGSWKTPTPENECYMAVIKDDGTVGKGGHRCNEVFTKGETLSIANGGTGATDKKTAFTNLVYLGGNPVTEETDTIAAWKELGYGVAYISGNGVLKGQPSKYGFLYNYTVGGNLIHQVFQSCSTSASTYHRCGGEGEWYNTGWVLEFNVQNLNPATLDSTGKVEAAQASSNLVGIDASTTLNSSHCGKFLRASSNSAITITIPDSADIPNETEIEILRYGAGNVTISAASNINLRGIGSTAVGESYKITDRYGVAVLKRIGSATWIISGAVEKA